MLKKRLICNKCASEKQGDYCPFCNKETPTNESIEIYGKHRLKGLFNIMFGC